MMKTFTYNKNKLKEKKRVIREKISCVISWIYREMKKKMREDKFPKLQNKFKRNLRFNFLMVVSEMRKFVNAPAWTWGSTSVDFSPSEELHAFPLQFKSDFVS